MREMLEKVLGAALEGGAQFADMRVADGTGTSVSVQDGRADRISSGRGAGAGLRVLVDGAWGFAPTNKVEEAELLQCVKDAVEMARLASANVTDPGMVAVVPPVVDKIVAPCEVHPTTIPLEERVANVFEFEKTLRETDPKRIVNSIANYRDGSGTLIIANTYGTYIEQASVRCGLSVYATAQEGDVRQWASKSRANLAGYEMVSAVKPAEFAGEVAQRAIELLSAERAPAGKFEVIIDPLICGLLVHEAFGHNCEADAVWAGDSILEGKIGEQVASDLVTVVDDPTLEGLNGSFKYDHEGVPAERHVLVKDGILQGFLHSLETAARMGERPNGAARGQGHSYPPIVRMSNTMIAPGKSSLEEMMGDIKQGLYLAGGHWGYVMTARGQFTCNVEHAYAIEDGKLGQHYRNVCISGLTLETLRNVVAVGNDVKFELGGMCGKDGQGMHVDSGGPHLRIRDVVVGGQEA